MSLSAWGIRNPIAVLVLFVLLSLAGVAAFRGMRINDTPDAEKPKVLIVASRPGSGPEELESQVTRLIETSVAGVGHVLHIQSTIADGVSTTLVEFEVGADRERATNDVRNAVAGLRGALPADMQEPAVRRVDTAETALTTYVLDAPQLGLEAQSWFVDNDVRRALLALSGVGSVDRLGGVDREIEVELNADRLASLGLTATQVSQALAQTSGQFPGGQAQIGGVERAIRTQATTPAVQDLRNLKIAIVGGSAVRLGDVAQVQDRWAEPRTRARFNGREVVGFAVFRERQAAEVQTAERVQKALAILQRAHPGLTIRQTRSSVGIIQEKYRASLEALFLGAALAVAVVFLFLRDGRATLIAALAIPLSLVPTFAVLALFHQSLNAVTLLALSLTVGVLVDDAIVEIENIVRHMRGGRSAREAALEAADEIGLAVVATTFTIVAVFAPVGFMPGIVGQYFKAFALAACVSVLFSLLVARLLTPLMGAAFLKAHPLPDRDPPWMNAYLSWLGWSLKHRWTVLVGGLALFGASAALAPLLPLEFQPAPDVGQVAFGVELPPGATLDQTDQVVIQAIRLLQARPEVVAVTADLGPGGVNTASLSVVLTPKTARMNQQAFSRMMVDRLSTLPGARIGDAGQNGGFYTLRLLSDDVAALDSSARRIEMGMRAIPGLAHVMNTEAIARPEIRVTPRLEEAATLGVSPAALAQTIRVATLGDVDQALAKFDLGDRQAPIRVRLDESSRSQVSMLETLKIPTSAGVSVPLSAVADVRYGAGVAEVRRQDRYRVADITAELDGLRESQASEKVHALAAVRNLPAGVTQAPAGASEQVAELISGFSAALPLGLLLMYAVLVLLFRSISQPITIMSALPLAVGGAFLLLFATRASFSVSTLIGILMLLGIAAKNSILLVEYAITARARGLNLHDALMDAGLKRARPILMTTVAMGAGMAPIALGFGADVEFRAPMAIAVIGGLITSTLLSLIYVPVVFNLMDGLRERLLRRPRSPAARPDVTIPDPEFT